MRSKSMPSLFRVRKVHARPSVCVNTLTVRAVGFCPFHLLPSLLKLLLIVCSQFCGSESSFLFLINTLLGLFPQISFDLCFGKMH